MAIPNLSDEQMRGALKAIEQATYNHVQWAETLNATMICRLTPDERDMAPDAHRLCRFGQWYFAIGIPALGKHAGFEELGREHEFMHRQAAHLLRASAAGETIAVGDYELFTTAMKRLKLELETLHHELSDALYNLDPLTGTPSRVGMLSKLRDEHEMVKRNLQACVIAMLDIDNFKAVNDTYGHVAGDKVLIAFAQHARSRLRSYDKIFRYGGEEFLACFPATDLEEGREIVDRLRREFAALTHDGGGAGTFHVTLSGGVTLLDPDTAVERSIDRADRALYAAKASGRDQIAVWDASMDALPEDATASPLSAP